MFSLSGAHLHLLFQKLCTSGNPKEETQPIVDVCPNWLILSIAALDYHPTNSLRLRRWLEQQQDICRLHMAVLQWTTEALLAESVVRGAPLHVLQGCLLISWLIDWVVWTLQVFLLVWQLYLWAHSSFIQCNVGKCSQLDHNFCRSQLRRFMIYLRHVMAQMQQEMMRRYCFFHHPDILLLHTSMERLISDRTLHVFLSCRQDWPRILRSTSRCWPLSGWVWWFQTVLFLITPTWGNDPIWQI